MAGFILSGVFFSDAITGCDYFCAQCVRC